MRRRLLAGLAISALVLPAALRAQATLSWEAVLPASTPGAPLLQIDMPYLAVTVRGVSGDTIRVRATRIGGSLTPIAHPRQAGGVVSLVDSGNDELLHLAIEVPARTDVQVRTGNGENVRITDVHGAIGIENSNAGVMATGILGPVAITTSNGGIEAVFATDRPTGPLSFITSNGPVSLSFPGPPAVDVALETDNGRIVSAFPLAPIRGVRGQDGTRATTARIGTGGVLLRVRTDNGDIHLEERIVR